MKKLKQLVELFSHTSGDEPSYLIVGLGNPGARYALNRHNVGFQCIDRLTETYGIPLRKKRFKARYGEGTIEGHLVVLAKPLTFMNSSGKAVAPLSRHYHLAPQRVLVIHDDLDLPLGRVRLRPGGSSGGHRGLKSIIEALGTQDFPRLRIGIGRPAQGDPIDYVLSDFDPDQEPIIQAVYKLVLEIIPYFLREGIEETMNAYNGRQVFVP